MRDVRWLLLVLALAAGTSLAMRPTPARPDPRLCFEFHSRRHHSRFDFSLEGNGYQASWERGGQSRCASGTLSEPEREEFVAGLERAGVWQLADGVSPDRPHAEFDLEVSGERGSHRAHFYGLPSPAHRTFLRFVHDSLPGRLRCRLIPHCQHRFHS